MSANWPAGFSAFPSSPNPAAANAWFAEAGNQDFSAWEDAVGEQPGDWKTLELCLRTVTGLDTEVVTAHLKDAVASVYTGVNMKKDATSQQRVAIGDAASGALAATMTVAWRGAAAEWLKEACRVAAPRFIHLWKRATTERERKRKATHGDAPPAADDEEPEGPEEARITKKPKAQDQPPTRRQTSTRPSPRSTCTEVDQSTTKMQEPVATTSGLGSRAPPSQSLQQAISDRRIEVRLERGADAMELDHPQVFVIAADTIAHAGAILGTKDEIRVEHLMFDKFRALVELSFDVRGGDMVLLYEKQTGSRRVKTEIRGGEGFQSAIVNLDWWAKHAEALVMTVRITR